MIKNIAKSLFKPSGSLYKFLSYFYNWGEKSYLPSNINTIEVILENLSKNQSPVTFIQVGSNDGISGDPINRFINSYDWEGVLIEPVPFLFEKLQSNYKTKKDKLQFLNIAVGSEDDAFKTFYAIGEEFRDKVPEWYFQLGSFNRDVLYHHGIPGIDTYIIPRDVPVSTIEKVSNSYLKQPLDLLHIDTEGYDYEILKTVNFSKTKPKVILIEYIHLDVPDRKKMIALLKSHQYKIYRCNNDFACIQNSFHDALIKGTVKHPFWQ